MISIIVAVSENGVIGKNNQLIWHLPADLKRFKQLTMGHHIVMGRKTFESIGRALPGRTSVIITKQKDYQKENCLVAGSVEKAIALCNGDDEIFITGGAEIYKLALPLADKIYLTRVHHSFDGDTFFPELNFSEWKETFREDHKADEKNPYDYSFVGFSKLR